MSPKLAYYLKPVHVIGTSVVMPVVDIIVVGLRFRVRRLQKLPLGLDDWIMIPATLMTMLIGVDMIYGTSRKALACYTEMPPGSNDDLTFVTITDQILLSFKVGYMFNLSFILAIGSIRASILFFYLRVFSVMKGKVRVILIILIAIVAMWTVAWLFESIFNCKLNFWAVQGASKDLKTKCVDFSSADLSLCITDFVIDIAIIAFPIPLIWNLNVSTRRKIATSGIFLLGFATIATSLVRLVMTAEIVAVGMRPTSDQVLIITKYLYWGIIECSIGVIVACLPTLAFLFKHLSWESIMAAPKCLFSSVCLRSKRHEDDPLEEQRLEGDVYKKKASSSTRSSSSSKPRISTTSIDDDSIWGLESYHMEDIVGAKESV